MNYQDYITRTQRAANLVESGIYDRALEILQALVASDISDIDKSMMCVNVAGVYKKQGRVDQALAWFDRGIAFERPLARAFVTMQKAGFLATQGYVDESRDLYRELANLPFLTESEKETIRRNLATLS